MAGFVYSPLPEDHPVDEATYWARKAQQHNATMAAKREANPVDIPSLSEIYRESDQAQAVQARQRQVEIASSPFAFTGEGMPVPRNDPKAIEARLKMINGEPA